MRIFWFSRGGESPGRLRSVPAGTDSKKKHNLMIMYIGMVWNKLMLTNNYINVHWMLITSNTLNTSNTDIYSNKVKDVIMRAKQDTNNSLVAHL